MQYDKAEKFDKEVRAEVSKRRRSTWDDPLWNAMCSAEADQREKGREALDAALNTVLGNHGISVDFQLEDQQQDQLLLTAA